MRISNLTLFTRSTNLDAREYPKAEAAVGMSLYPECLRHTLKKCLRSIHTYSIVFDRSEAICGFRTLVCSSLVQTVRDMSRDKIMLYFLNIYKLLISHT